MHTAQCTRMLFSISNAHCRLAMHFVSTNTSHLMHNLLNDLTTSMKNMYFIKMINLNNSISFSSAPPPKKTKYLDLPIVEDDQSPGGSYENLRKIIHTVVQEVIRLPEFYNQRNVGTAAVTIEKDKETSTPFEPKKYEDLLATAVINKVIYNRLIAIYMSISGTFFIFFCIVSSSFVVPYDS